MIKTVIKHLIYEACIHQLFSGIEKNFIPFNTNRLIPGKLYNKIFYKDRFRNRISRNLKFMHIRKYENFDGLWAVFTYKGRNRMGISLNSIYNVE